MNEVFENITVRTIAQVINEKFNLIIDGLDDLSAQHAILNQIDDIFSTLAMDMKRKVFFVLYEYNLYRKCNYSLRPIDYIIALGDIELLECLKAIRFDFNELNNLGECPLQTLILFDGVVRDTLPIIKLLVNQYNARVTPQVIGLVQELGLSEGEERSDELQLFLDQNLPVPDSRGMGKP